MEPLYTASATSIGGRNGKVTSSDGVLNLEIRPPVEMRGKESGHTNPEQLFAAGYAACFASALNHIALAQRKRIESQVTANVSLYKNEDKGYKLEVKMDVNVSGVDQQEAQELVEQAHHFCPYSNAIRNNVKVELNVTTNNL
ncbi:MAG: organic hydroperoxide resistance protein [Odoribacter sp.]|nr:organic hydroperoxide resistance protein [Odoribacter sp.]